MNIRLILIVLCFLMMSTGCDETITGRVVDAQTGQPIEGAVILVEWTKTGGLPGMTHTKSYKVVEVVTDREGKATIEGVTSLSASSPRVTVYKKGYVAWNNLHIFPDYERRTDFKWKNNYVFKLEKFRPEYGYVEHTGFIGFAISSNIAMNLKQKMFDAYKWEHEKSSEERDAARKKKIQ